jgi:outer membrane immunogenic protein
MRRTICAATGFAAILFAGAAMAADAPVRAPVQKAVVAAPPSTWAGGYVGIQGGWGWGDTSHSNPDGSFFSGSFDVDGALLGFTSGYNWQSGAWVAGYESDFSKSWIDGTVAGGACGLPCFTDMRWLSTYRLRAGPSTPEHFVFVTGGVAVGDVKAGAGPFTDKETMVGWTAGIGWEGRVAPMWTAKVEYLYVDLGKDGVHVFGGNPFKTNVRFDTHIVRAGLNYKFSFWDWLLQRR